MQVTKERFCEVIFYLLASKANRKAIEQDCELFSDEQGGAEKVFFGIKLDNEEEFYRLFSEFFSLYMWMIVETCDRVLQDKNKSDQILDMFHKMVYEKVWAPTNMGSYDKWTLGLFKKYDLYYDAFSDASASLSLEGLVGTVIRNLHGNARPNNPLFTRLQIAHYFTSTMIALKQIMEKYEIS